MSSANQIVAFPVRRPDIGSFEKPEDVYVLHPSMEEDIAAIYADSSAFDRMFPKLNNKLIVLGHQKQDCIGRLGFKLMKKTKGLFRLEMKDDMNFRIIFDFREIFGCQNCILLLHAFSEKNGQADYRKAIKVANERKKLLI